MQENLAELAKFLLFTVAFPVVILVGVLLLFALVMYVYKVAYGESSATDSEKELKQLKQAYADLDRRHASYLKSGHAEHLKDKWEAKNEQGEN